MGGSEKTKLVLYSTLVEIEIEVGVELGKKELSDFILILFMWWKVQGK